MKQKLIYYEEELERQNLAASTIQTYLRSARQFIDFIAGQAVSGRLVREYSRFMEQRHFKASTINLNLIAINKFLRFCHYGDCTIKVERLPQRQSLNHVLEPKDYHKLLKHAKQSGREKYYFLMKTLAKTGIRISELSYITVEACNKGVTQVHNKGRFRDVYLPDGLIAELRQYCRREKIESGSIFIGNKGTPVSRKAVWKMLKKLASEAGVDECKVHPHAFRHYFSLSYMNQYGNIFELADFLGHANVETTRIYSKSTVEQKRKRLDTIGE